MTARPAEFSTVTPLINMGSKQGRRQPRLGVTCASFMAVAICCCLAALASPITAFGSSGAPSKGQSSLWTRHATLQSTTALRISLRDDDDIPMRDGRMLDELAWRAEKIRLEEENTRSFLKRKPRKLPYEDARRWVQANLGPDTKEDFDDLVENGNLRTPYIPKRPEEYYGELNEWISWDHFLHGLYDVNCDREPPSAIKPASGAFD